MMQQEFMELERGRVVKGDLSGNSYVIDTRTSIYPHSYIGVLTRVITSTDTIEEVLREKDGKTRRQDIQGMLYRLHVGDIVRITNNSSSISCVVTTVTSQLVVLTNSVQITNHDEWHIEPVTKMDEGSSEKTRL